MKVYGDKQIIGQEKTMNVLKNISMYTLSYLINIVNIKINLNLNT